MNLSSQVFILMDNLVPVCTGFSPPDKLPPFIHAFIDWVNEGASTPDHKIKKHHRQSIINSQRKMQWKELFFVGIGAGDEFVNEIGQVAVEGLGILYHDEMA